MQLSVIILNYNVRYFLEQCLITVTHALQGLDAEIIVVDNASVDDSCQMVKEQFPQVTLIKNEENVGFSKANNQAAKIAKGTYLCILNPDTAILNHTFRECLRFAEKAKDMGALGIQYIDGTGNFLPESKRNFPTPKRSFLKFLGFTKGKNGYYANHVSVIETGPVEVLAGAFMFLKKEVFDLVNGFDEEYFMYGEDIDLSYKIMQAGFQNYYMGSVSMLHYKGESTQRNRAYLDRFYGAMKIFSRKHFGKQKLLNILVSAGVSLTKFFKMSVSQKMVAVPSASEALLLTEDLSFIRKLSEALDIPVKSVSIANIKENTVTNKMLVFDTHMLSYEVIFKIMQQQCNQGNIFRIRPKERSFIIGSDQSDQKGGVQFF